MPNLAANAVHLLAYYINTHCAGIPMSAVPHDILSVSKQT